MTQEELNEVSLAIREARSILILPVKDRTGEQIRNLSKLTAYIVECQEEFFAAKSGKIFDPIINETFELGELITHWETVSVDSKMAFPNLGRVTTTESINQALDILFSIQATVQGALEELEPTLTQYNEIINIGKNLTKLVSLSTSEWEGEALFQLFVPDKVSDQYLRLKYVVDIYKRKEKAIEELFKILSRIITVRLENPEDTYGRGRGTTNPSQTVDTPRPHAAKGPAMEQPSWRNRAKK